MRKISIVQRRLETGLDLTQAELRALQRETTSQSVQGDDSENTATAVRNPLSILPPTRPPELRPENSGSYSEEHSKEGESGFVRQAGSDEQNEVASASFPESVEAVPGNRGEVSTTESLRENPRSSVEEAVLSSSVDDLRTAVNDIFGGEDFTFEGEAYEEESADQGDPLYEEWEGQGDTVFPSEQEGVDFSGSANQADHSAVSEFSENQPSTKEETLVLFLLQVPEGGLAATFTASQDVDSPFAGQLRLYSEGDDSKALPGEASEFDVNLPPEGLVRLSTGKFDNNGHEWALISLDEEARAYATFDLRAGRNMKATAAVFSRAPSRVASIPLETGFSEDSGLVLANPTDGPVIVNLSLYDEAGNQRASLTSQDPLPAGKQIAVFAKAIFRDTPGISSFKGRMVAEVVGEGLIWTAGLDQNGGILSFLPVHEIEESTPPPS